MVHLERLHLARLHLAGLINPKVGLIMVHPTLSVFQRVPDTSVLGTIRKIQI